jgi:hypothetical protein
VVDDASAPGGHKEIILQINYRSSVGRELCVGVWGVGASWRATRDPGPRASFEPLLSAYGASGGNSNYVKQSYWPNL